MLTVAAIGRDLWAPLLLAVVGAAVAVVFPWLQTHWRGLKFQGIIKRELEELAPCPPDPQRNTPWWEHLRKRFVHEEIFARREISANRDFLLSLNPDVVYGVSQLWTAFEKRDTKQWLRHLSELAHDRRVGSPKLVAAHQAWAELLAREETGTALPVRDTGEAERDALLEARLGAYVSLLGLTRYGSEDEPFSMSHPEREQREEKLAEWFYNCGGLLLSSEAHVALGLVRERLTDPQTSDGDRWKAFTALRTELKIDLGVRRADVRRVQMAALPAED